MRLATAADEILPMKDSAVIANPAYKRIIVLSRVIVRLGSVTNISANVIENLFVSDLADLQNFYEQINEDSSGTIKTICPKCEHSFDVEVVSPGE